MAMASTVKLVLGVIAFAVFWVLAVFPAVPFLPIGRTAGSLFGAMMMVLFRVITPEQAYAAVDLQILGLLFGTMVVSVYLERADMFKYLGKLLSWRSKGGKDLLCRICLFSAVASALFTNDTCCVVLTEFVLKIARQNNLPPQPFLIALASSANIGSSATPIGNPQNLVIAVQSGIPFGKFVAGIILAMIVGVVLNCCVLLSMYWKILSIEKDEEDASAEVVAEEEVHSHRFSPATLSHFESPANAEDVGSGFDGLVQQAAPSEGAGTGADLKLSHSTPVDNTTVQFSHSSFERERISNASRDQLGSVAINHERDEGVSSRRSLKTFIQNRANGEDGSPSVLSCSDEKGGFIDKWKAMLWKTCVYLVTLGMVMSLLMGLNMSWTAITAAIALVVLDFKDARPCLEKVSYSLLVFFCGMFITIEGFNKTGVPSTCWDTVEPYARIDKFSC
ncbi:silicon efflux transporter LSI3 isoform X2 [Nymphaea colorata]|uniref:silicon efflux transporter LSI3 isoform X2 n=1 Tax=Nymphaea colorata TaxID=210225 RepID=UPI00214EB1C8|nr:silicon efflux transporter LSI3 isoform X2 [Nymphaea colorata]